MRRRRRRPLKREFPCCVAKRAAARNEQLKRLQNLQLFAARLMSGRPPRRARQSNLARAAPRQQQANNTAGGAKSGSGGGRLLFFVAFHFISARIVSFHFWATLSSRRPFRRRRRRPDANCSFVISLAGGNIRVGADCAEAAELIKRETNCPCWRRWPLRAASGRRVGAAFTLH